ncbi:TPA: hypothetical protein UN269_000097 [Stenotrophomonas maltophilia]|nr:hypothetical protein [Stenotrophomonas maltophilia]
MNDLILLWPSKDLSPNARVPFRVKASATKYARQAAVVLTHEAGWRALQLPPGKLHLWGGLQQAPRKALPDNENMLKRLKTYPNGIAQVPGIDGKRFISHPLVSSEHRPGGWVVIRITGRAEAAVQRRQEQGNAG